MDYIDKIDKIIPIGVQKFAYQGGYIHDFATKIIGELPMSNGALPYPNDEKKEILRYELEVKRFTSNAVEITLTKNFKDGTKHLYLTSMTFEQFVNQIFQNFGANVSYDWK